MLIPMVFALFMCLYVANWAIVRCMKYIMEKCQAEMNMPHAQACEEIVFIFNYMNERLSRYPDPHNPAWVGTPGTPADYLDSLYRAELPQ